MNYLILRINLSHTDLTPTSIRQHKTHTDQMSYELTYTKYQFEPHKPPLDSTKPTRYHPLCPRKVIFYVHEMSATQYLCLLYFCRWQTEKNSMFPGPEICLWFEMDLNFTRPWFVEVKLQNKRLMQVGFTLLKMLLLALRHVSGLHLF